MPGVVAGRVSYWSGFWYTFLPRVDFGVCAVAEIGSPGSSADQVRQDDARGIVVVGRAFAGKRKPKTKLEWEEYARDLEVFADKAARDEERDKRLLELEIENRKIQIGRQARTGGFEPPKLSETVLNRTASIEAELRWAVAKVSWPPESIPWDDAPSPVAVTMLWNALQSPVAADRLVKMYADVMEKAVGEAARRRKAQIDDDQLEKLVERLHGEMRRRRELDASLSDLSEGSAGEPAISA